jgi:mRNA-degrading endonuclease RelE of RelBE toxin-antitoxin system
MEFIEVSTFRSSAGKLFDEDDIAALQMLLLLHPDAGAVIPGSGGLRKVRVPAKGKGKRGGGRVIYYWLTADDQIFLIYAYAKNERTDITPKQAKAFLESLNL